jgi:hypothetical protein
MGDSPRSSAAKAKRAARLNEDSLIESQTDSPKPSVKISNLSFQVDTETERLVEQERSKVRDTLDGKE